MLTKRITPGLDIKEGRTVKGTNFVDLRDAGDPVEEEFLVSIHVVDHHLELVIGLLAGDEQALQYLRDFGDVCFEIGEAFRSVQVHGYADEGHQG